MLSILDNFLDYNQVEVSEEDLLNMIIMETKRGGELVDNKFNNFKLNA